jgi:pimeloyl-ACP methyl ester carboxylesterase
LIIWGEKDRIVPTNVAYELNNKIKDSKLYIIPKIGHNPDLECPDKLSKIINEFHRSL